MSMVKFVNEQNLITARENMGLSTREATSKVSQSKEDLVLAWEKGESLPTWSQIRKLSKLYNVPELLFFSNENLKKQKIIPDYRVGANSESNIKIYKLINLITSRQKWLERELRSQGVPKNTLLGSGKSISNPRDLAKFISSKLEIDLEVIKKISGTHKHEKTLKYLIHKAENKGIFVGKTISYHKIEVKDMRGLFISNDYCPYIILNRKDARTAQIFSFIHELSHFFRKSDAISNSLDFRTTDTRVDREEVFCNQTAAEFLLPASDFSKKAYSKEDIDELADLYKVSKIFIFYRLKDLGKVSSVYLKNIESMIKEETEENVRRKNSKKASGGNHTNNMKDSNGGLFNKVVSKSYLENKLDYVEASNLLKFSPENI